MAGKENDTGSVWITAQEAMVLLGWTNPESIRQLRLRGWLRFSKRPNGRVLYLRSDVEEYRDRAQGSTEEAAA